MKQAVIDLGTNTFHLLIVNKQPDDSVQTLFRESRAAKIGQGGINAGILTEDGMGRAVAVLSYFRQVLDQHSITPDTVTVIGTSAIRVARNQAEFLARVQQATGLRVRVIAGDEEADLIYRGVRASGALDERVALIVDIGGGSVEFIIGSRERVYWKQSFEIGGQRLRERFMTTDPISEAAIDRLDDYFREQLIPLTNAVHQYAPTRLVGSSGSFDSLVDMHHQHERGAWPPPEQTNFSLPIGEFYRSYALLTTKNQADRLALPGMIELRVDMIVVAVCLIDYVLTAFSINEIKVSSFALKEGVLADV